MKKGFLIISVLLVLLGCNENIIIEEHLKVADAEWHRNEKALFSFDIADTLALYDYYLTIRHGGDYPYKNLYLFNRMKSPENKVAMDTAQMIFANQQGRWLGNGIGDIYAYEFKFKEHIRFPVSGTYEIELEQGMRDLVIPAITDIGIRIEKVEIEE